MINLDGNIEAIMQTFVEDDCIPNRSDADAFERRLKVAQCFTMDKKDLRTFIETDIELPQDVIEVNLPFDDMYIDFRDVSGLSHLGMMVCSTNVQMGNAPLIIMTVTFRNGTHACPAYGVLRDGQLWTEASSRITEDEIAFVRENFDFYARVALQMLYALVEGVLVEYTPSSFRRKKRKHKAKKKSHRVTEYKILRINLSKSMVSEEHGGSHASPRLHLRRGHWRNYKDGHRTWIKPMWVGDKDRGVIHKEYEVKV